MPAQRQACSRSAVQSVVYKGMLLSVLFAIGSVLGSTRPAPEEPPALAVHYLGDITSERNRRFFASMAGLTRPFTRLRITSRGGEVEAGIALGRWVFARGMDVEVAEYCLSSCANYVFPAGKNKRILPGAIVAWHGNYRHLLETDGWRDDVGHRMRVYGEDPVSARRNARTTLDRLVRLEKAFFSDIEVDDRICWIGKMPPHNAPNYYFLSKEDMAAFGLGNLQVPPGYASTDVSGLGVHVIHVDLGDHRPASEGVGGN